MAEVHVYAGDRVVSAAVGDLVVVRLVEPDVSGQAWSTVVVGRAVSEEFSTLVVPEEAPDDDPGSTGSGEPSVAARDRTLGLRAVEAGTAEVTVVRRAVWGRAADVVLAFRVEVS